MRIESVQNIGPNNLLAARSLFCPSDERIDSFESSQLEIVFATRPFSEPEMLLFTECFLFLWPEDSWPQTHPNGTKRGFSWVLFHLDSDFGWMTDAGTNLYNLHGNKWLERWMQWLSRIHSDFEMDSEGVFSRFRRGVIASGSSDKGQNTRNQSIKHSTMCVAQLMREALF